MSNNQQALDNVDVVGDEERTSDTVKSIQELCDEIDGTTFDDTEDMGQKAEAWSTNIAALSLPEFETMKLLALMKKKCTSYRSDSEDSDENATASRTSKSEVGSTSPPSEDPSPLIQELINRLVWSANE